MKKKFSLRLPVLAAFVCAAFLPVRLVAQLETPPPAQESSAPAAAAQSGAAASGAKAAASAAQPSTTGAQSHIPAAGSAEADRPAVPVAEIVARINDNIISKADLARAQEQLDSDIRQDNVPADQAEVRRAATLSDLIDQQLLLSRAKQIDINPDDEVIRRLDEMRKQYHMDSMEELEKAAQQQGVSFEDFKQNVRNGVITQMVVRQEVSRNMHMTTDELKAYYRAHRSEFQVPESVHLSEILIPTADTDASVEEAHQRAIKISDELQKGSDFATMAKSVSQGPTAQQGGELGEFKRGQLAKELEDKTFALKAGGVTDPIRTRQGYVVLKVTAHQAAGVQPFEAVQDQLQNNAYQERMQPALRAYLTKLREEAFIDIRPGYTDVHASPNESHPVFSAYAPPPKKKDKTKNVKYRFRDKSVMPKDVPPPPPAKPNLEQVKAQPGGPTAIGTSTYQTAEANPPAKPGTATTAAVSKTRMSAKPAKNNSKPIKVRYGQNQPVAQLPPAAASTDSGAAADSSTQVASANGPTAGTENLSPESRKILGLPAEQGEKTRFASRPVASRTQKHAEEQATRDSNAPPPADADETTTRAVTSQPLGLNGDTAHVSKPKLTDKQRLQQKTQVATTQQPNAGTPGSADYQATDTDAPVAPPQAKRHKLLGIL